MAEIAVTYDNHELLASDVRIGDKKLVSLQLDVTTQGGHIPSSVTGLRLVTGVLGAVNASPGTLTGRFVAVLPNSDGTVSTPGACFLDVGADCTVYLTLLGY